VNFSKLQTPSPDSNSAFFQCVLLHFNWTEAQVAGFGRRQSRGIKRRSATCVSRLRTEFPNSTFSSCVPDPQNSYSFQIRTLSLFPKGDSKQFLNPLYQPAASQLTPKALLVMTNGNLESFMRLTFAKKKTT